jgi:hypothetical protein
MIVILLLVFAAVGAITLLGGNNDNTAMDEYCRLECKDRKIQDHSICC